MKLRLGQIGVITLALCGVLAGAAQAQPTLNAPTVVGADITFTWSGGVAPFTLQAGVAPGTYFVNLPVGGGPTFGVTAPAVGVFFARIVDANGAGSNEVQVVVSSLIAPPAVPTNLQVFRNGTGVVISWTPGSGGGAASAFQLRAGLTPGGSEVGVIPTAATGVAAGGVPANTYYLAVRAVNAGGVSGESAEVALVMPPGGACDAPPTPTLTTTAWGQYLTAAWTPVPGAGAYYLSASGPGVPGVTVPFGGASTTFVYRPLPIGTWNFGIQAQFSCGALGGVGASTLVVDGASLKLTPREPDPAPGQALPTPGYALSIVQQIGAQYDGELQQSCKEHGGNNRWLFRLVNALRQRDKRWGLNWKRANEGDMSQDIVTYNWSSDPDEGTFNTRVYDVIGNHCGNGRVSAQLDEKTILGSTGAKWTLIPYIQAGYVP